MKQDFIMMKRAKEGNCSIVDVEQNSLLSLLILKM